MGLLLHCLPDRWMRRPEKLAGRLEKLRYPGGRNTQFPSAAWEGLRWYSPVLRRRLPDWHMPLPDMDWLRRIRRMQPFCPHMTVILPDFGEGDRGRELEKELFFLEDFLQEDYEGRNSLLLISRALEESGPVGELPLMEVSPYCERIYLETGLVTRCAGEWRGAGPGKSVKVGLHVAELSGDNRQTEPAHLCIDLRNGYRVPFRILPQGTLYLDMTSDAARERLLNVKRKDVYYTSPMNVLDTYVRNRYNTNRRNQV